VHLLIEKKHAHAVPLRSVALRFDADYWHAITRYCALDGLPLSEAQRRSHYLPSVDTPMMQAMER
jgi:hypothetical protein